jgi:hypothetical protein
MIDNATAYALIEDDKTKANSQALGFRAIRLSRFEKLQNGPVVF